MDLTSKTVPMKRIFIYVFMAMGLFSGCSMEGIFAPIQTLEVDREELLAPAIGASYSISVNSNTSWKAELTSDGWISCDAEDFVGSRSLNVVFRENEGQERSCCLVLSLADGSITRRVNLRQGAAMEDGQIAIAQLRDKEKDADNGEYIFSGPALIKGFVTTDLADKNFYDDSFAMQDGFVSGASGITVCCKEMLPDFLRGDEVEIDLDGATLKRNDYGVLTLYPEKSPVRTQTNRIDVKPMPIMMTSLASGEYESMFVSVYNLQPIKADNGGTLEGGIHVEDQKSASAFVKVFEESLFKEATCQGGRGSVTGIAGKAAEGENAAVIIPTKVSDLAFEGVRFETLTGGVSKFPYMLSLFSYNGKNDTEVTPEYINYEVTPYNSGTKFIDAYYYDKDEDTDVSLHVHAAGRTESEVRSELYWGNSKGFDSVPAKSFVTRQSAAGEYPGDSYYLLTMPLKSHFIDAGGTFSVAFYVWNTDWAVRDWKLEYSLDMHNWYGYDEISGTGEGVVELMPAGNFALYNVKFTAQTTIDKSDILYIRFSPFGKRASKGGASIATGWGSDVRLSVGMLVCPHVERRSDTEIPANAVWYNTFDSLTEGSDYMMGNRLGVLDNLNGPLIGLWSETQKNGMTGTNVAMRPGYAQVGYVEYATDGLKVMSYKGTLQTPSLEVEGEFNLSFKAMTFRSSRVGRIEMHESIPEKGPDAQRIDIEIADGGKIVELDGKRIDAVSELTIFGLPFSEFKTYNIKIEGATKQTSVIFKSAENIKFTRWFIDDIIVTQ